MKTPSKIALSLVLSLCPIAALAQDGPIATSSSEVDSQIAAFLNHSAEPLAVGPEEASVDAEAPPDRAVHGEFGVGIGTGGYRHVHAATVVPVGEVGTAAIAVSDTRFNGRNGRQNKLQSLSVAVDLTGAGRTRSPCEVQQERERKEPWRAKTRLKEGKDACAQEASR